MQSTFELAVATCIGCIALALLIPATAPWLLVAVVLAALLANCTRT